LKDQRGRKKGKNRKRRQRGIEKSRNEGKIKKCWQGRKGLGRRRRVKERNLRRSN